MSVNPKLLVVALAAALSTGMGRADAATDIVSAYDSDSAANLTNLDSGPFPGGVIGKSWLVKNSPSLTEVIFDEQQDVVLSTPLLTDATGAGGPKKVGAGPTIAAGTEFDSVLIFFDTKRNTHETATVVFNKPILGLEYAEDSHGVATGLVDSDFLGLPGHTYDLGCVGCGFERSPGDSVNFAGDVLTLSSLFSRPGDYLRVILSASPAPEPSAWALMILGFAILGAALRSGRCKAAPAV
jgi:hypothetical protein